jgi:hypothetical protein
MSSDTAIAQPAQKRARVDPSAQSSASSVPQNQNVNQNQNQSIPRANQARGGQQTLGQGQGQTFDNPVGVIRPERYEYTPLKQFKVSVTMGWI